VRGELTALSCSVAIVIWVPRQISVEVGVGWVLDVLWIAVVEALIITADCAWLVAIVGVVLDLIIGLKATNL